MLKGKKTYIIGTAMVAVGIALTAMDQKVEGGLFIANGLGQMGIRHGITTEAQKTK